MPGPWSSGLSAAREPTPRKPGTERRGASYPHSARSDRKYIGDGTRLIPAQHVAETEADAVPRDCTAIRCQPSLAGLA